LHLASLISVIKGAVEQDLPVTLYVKKTPTVVDTVVLNGVAGAVAQENDLIVSMKNESMFAVDSTKVLMINTNKVNVEVSNDA